MAQELYQQVVDRNVPQLVKLLLGSVQEDEAFKACRQFSLATLRHHSYKPTNARSVFRSLNHFLERFTMERLAEFGETFQLLVNMVVKHSTDLQTANVDLKWSLIDFMLCANYEAFKHVRLNRRDMEVKRLALIKAIEAGNEKQDTVVGSSEDDVTFDVIMNPIQQMDKDSASLTSTSETELEDEWEVRTPTRQSCDLFSVSSSIDGDTSQVSTLSMTQAEEAADKQSPSAADNEVVLTETFVTPEAELTFSLNVVQLSPAAIKPSQVNYYRGAHELLTQMHTQGWTAEIHIHPNLSHAHTSHSFAASYADYMQHQLHNNSCPVPQLTPECCLLREVIIMFFHPRDCIYFQLLNQRIEARSSVTTTCTFDLAVGNLLETEILPPLREVQMLRKFINYYTSKSVGLDHIRTLFWMGESLWWLIKPITEAFLYFDRRLSLGMETASLSIFLKHMRTPLQRIRLLSQLTSQSYLWFFNHLHPLAHVRSLYTLSNLMGLATVFSGVERAHAIVLLLQTLRAYCDFLDSWWRSGDFNDSHGEFPALRLKVDHRTVYGMRPLDCVEKQLTNNRIYWLIQQHVLLVGPAIALLYDTLRLADFVNEHETFLTKSLHSSLMEGVLRNLKPYILSGKVIQSSPKIPDILQQLRATEDPELRTLLFSYYNETLPDRKQSARCSVPELLRRFANCVEYTPLEELIYVELERQLAARSLLFNAFIVHFMREQIYLGGKLRLIRSVCLCLDINIFREQFDPFFEHLDQHNFKKSLKQLHYIIAAHNPRLSYIFGLELGESEKCANTLHVLERITLHVKRDTALACIVTNSQVAVYNAALRMMLQYYWAIWKLLQLPVELGAGIILCYASKCAIEGIHILHSNLMTALHQWDLHPVKRVMEQAARCCDTGIKRCESLQQLQHVHLNYINYLASNFLSTSDNTSFQSGLPEVLQLVIMLTQLRYRVQYLMVDNSRPFEPQIVPDKFDLKYDELADVYYKSIRRMCVGLHCILQMT
ncbi:uncharacterized protein LOC115622557 [Scaptodrosophila lebanonensis]|uniref:Uncharacterized protein LOC115622557 n=1 Tax=Drosophila lebanonensis TaxID=7225 RepID=A0A6J2T634_DROLE|nr:uncharacterized protein LOC115622557 [Scaptodrosophila lebanonensis]